MSRYTKLDPKNPAAGMRYTRTRHAQEKDRIRRELDAALEALGVRFSRQTRETLDRRLGADGLAELRTEFRALLERIRRGDVRASVDGDVPLDSPSPDGSPS